MLISSKAARAAAGILAAAAGVTCAAAEAAETIAYEYDARGRLTTVARTLGQAAPVVTAYTLDRADNRTAMTIGGGGGTPPTGAGGPVFSIADASATEGSSLGFTISRGGDTASAASIFYSTADGTALHGSDYGPASSTLDFAAGETAKTLTVATWDDTVAEPTETMAMTLAHPSSGASIADGAATGTIADNDAAGPIFAVSDASAAEGTSLAFTISRGGNTQVAASIFFSTADGSAVHTADYGPASSTIDFAPGETSKTLTIATWADGIAEGPETMLMTLAYPSSGATIADGQGIGTITGP